MSTTMTPPEGWYQDPNEFGSERWWDGTQWTNATRPKITEAPGPAQSSATTESTGASLTTRRAVGLGLLAAAFLGFALTLQSASLLSGTGTQWTGAAIALTAAALGVALRKQTSRWAIGGAVLMSVLAIANVIYLEVQLEERRQEINEVFDDF